ncbi:hypothetical protein AB0C65_34440 [Nocardia sp. NPDC048505]|uniref:hypothetical protein n=1 Tax=Nocardia sp. NPDC048505 TaxID=3155756 RepID=UPI0033F3CB35
MDVVLAELDRAFGVGVGRTAAIAGCSPHCFSAAELERLSGPLDRIPERELSRAVFKWGTTLDASVGWLRWVSPRLLRGVVEKSSDAELVGCRMFVADWRSWPEAAAIEGFCAGYWRAALSGAGCSAVDALSFLVALTGAVEPWLRIWTEDAGPVADGHFRELWQRWAMEILGGELDVCVYRDGPNIAPALAAWVLAEAPARIRRGALDPGGEWLLAQLPLPPESRWR